MTLAALEATLRIYRYDPSPETAVPTLRALLRTQDELDRIGASAVELLVRVLGRDFDVAVIDSEAQAGSGSQPHVTIPSRAVVVTSNAHSAESIARRFRGSTPPIIGRIERDRFLLDLRTVERAEDLVPDRS
jgi:L-seryl-tRNA(Ser) seleniumtransferase